jgi:hypothetical protein
MELWLGVWMRDVARKQITVIQEGYGKSPKDSHSSTEVNRKLSNA